MQKSVTILQRLHDHFNFKKSSIGESTHTITESLSKDKAVEWEYLSVFMRFIQGNKDQRWINNFFKIAPIQKFKYAFADKSFYNILTSIQTLSKDDFNKFTRDIDNDPIFKFITASISFDSIPKDARKLIYEKIKSPNDFFSLRTVSKTTFKDTPVSSKRADLSFSRTIQEGVNYNRTGLVLSKNNVLRILLLNNRITRGKNIQTLLRTKNPLPRIMINLAGAPTVAQHALFLHKNQLRDTEESALLLLTKEGHLHTVRDIKENCSYTKETLEALPFKTKSMLVKFIVPSIHKLQYHGLMQVTQDYHNSFGGITSKGELLLLPAQHNLKCYKFLDSIASATLYKLPKSEKAIDLAFNPATLNFFILSETNNLYRFDGESFDCVERNILAITSCDTHIAKLKLTDKTLELEISGEFGELPNKLEGLVKTWELTEKQLEQVHSKKFSLCTDNNNIYLHFDNKVFYMAPVITEHFSKIGMSSSVSNKFSDISKMFTDDSMAAKAKSVINSAEHGIFYADDANVIHRSTKIQVHADCKSSGKPVSLKEFAIEFDKMELEKQEKSMSHPSHP